MDCKLLELVNQAQPSSFLNYSNTLSELHSDILSRDSLNSIFIELLLLGACLENENLFIKNFSLDKLFYNKNDENDNIESEFETLRFHFSEDQVEYFDESDLEKLNNEKYNLWEEIKQNKLCMIKQSSKDKYELCISQAIYRAFACFEQNVTSNSRLINFSQIINNSLHEINSLNFYSNSCKEAYKYITKKEPIQKYFGNSKKSQQCLQEYSPPHSHYLDQSFSKEEQYNQLNGFYLQQGDEIIVPENLQVEEHI